MSNEKSLLSGRSQRRAFTLVELLVVVGIIAVLVSILLPSLNKARQAAVTIQCAARMRQITMATFMYVNDNKGSLPPLAMSETTFPSGGWGRPTIFPAGGEGFLTRYIAPTNKANQYSGIDTSKLYVCPDFEPTLGQNFNSVWTYRYNYILGGQDKVALQAAYGGGWTGSGSRFLIPWKISHVRDSSNMALFAEGDSPQSALNQSAVALSLEPAKNANGLYGHNARYGIYVHSMKLTATGFFGITNIGYCDGSVRSVQWKVTTYPKEAFPGTWINPYQVGNVTGWSNNTSYN